MYFYYHTFEKIHYATIILKVYNQTLSLHILKIMNQIKNLDQLRLKDPTVFTDSIGHHIIGLSKLKTGNNNMGYVFTEDFENFKDINLQLITAEENCSIWSGCIFKEKDTYYVFYTIRSSENGYWAKQTIKYLETNDFKTINFKTLNLTPELADNNSNIFQYLPQDDSYTPHSWRDPFVFKHEDKFYMLVAAKLNKKHFNATIALLVSDDLDNWTLLNPSIVPNHDTYEELELPSIVLNDSNEVLLMVCCWERDDYIDAHINGYSPLKHNTDKIIRRKGILMTFKAPSIEKALQGQFTFDRQIPTPSNFYAGRFTLNQNAIIGHDINNLSIILMPYNKG